MCLKQRWIRFVRQSSSRTVARAHSWQDLNGGVLEESIAIPAQPCHLLWFHRDDSMNDPAFPGKDMPVERAIESPDLIVPFLLVWLRARHDDRFIPGGYTADHSVFESAALMCALAAMYRPFFTVTVVPASQLYMTLFGAKTGADLSEAQRSYFQLNIKDTCLYTVEQLKSYNGIILDSMQCLKAVRPDHCEGLLSILERIEAAGLKSLIYPNLDLDIQFDCKELLYKALQSWKRFQQHALPTKIIRGGSAAEIEKQMREALPELVKASAFFQVVLGQSRTASPAHVFCSSQLARLALSSFRPLCAEEHRGIIQGRLSPVCFSAGPGRASGNELQATGRPRLLDATLLPCHRLARVSHLHASLHGRNRLHSGHTPGHSFAVYLEPLCG